MFNSMCQFTQHETSSGHLFGHWATQPVDLSYRPCYRQYWDFGHDSFGAHTKVIGRYCPRTILAPLVTTLQPEDCGDTAQMVTCGGAVQRSMISLLRFWLGSYPSVDAGDSYGNRLSRQSLNVARADSDRDVLAGRRDQY